MRFTVLGSGSSGNASLLQVDGFGLLVDAGLGPRQVSKRLAAFDLSWQQVQAVLLTHTHTDHWNERTLGHLHQHQVPLYCHEYHCAPLLNYSPAFGELQAANLVRKFEAGQDWELTPALRCRPFLLPHDGGPTFGFRFEGELGPSGSPVAMAYLADLGSWSKELAEILADVDLLALEFNHDVDMECASGRSPGLIARVLGDEGHLSNAQAAALLEEVVRRSAPGRLQHVIQLHLSRDCNRPTLAREAVGTVLARLAAQIEVHTAAQHKPGPSVTLGGPGAITLSMPEQSSSRSPLRPRRRAATKQPWFPGWEP